MSSRSGPGGDRLGQEDEEVRSAIRFAGVMTAVGVVFVVLATFWAGSCDPLSVTVTCGRPYRTVLGLGGPVILAGGGVRAFLRTYQVWRARGTWWGWQGAGWFLMSLMLFVLMMSAPPIIGMG
ncbi:hypothetical protein [[Mycobacterium] nativiensis]|uniref:Transmembrane protein n=1 Tax=[Mycobacterium] nativiensis TaxID=2855503 RepID=A0ABU5Y2T2_9MYCO|nr:hypothetical protein [Mycolicibacter sp. MYC340]MEB3033215.1 hypothetical protein [Mycolicibacter sp. MYC340]